MKILFTGGGTGGHFYPIVAIAEEIDRLVEERKLVGVEKHYMAAESYDAGLLLERDITFHHVSAGKVRAYFSPLNFLDIFKTTAGLLRAIVRLYFLFPDIIFGKGGSESFPALFAARVLGIPVMIHESDTVPGRVNRWAAKFALRIGLGFPEAAAHFKTIDKKKIAHTGIPVRRELFHPEREGAQEFLHLEAGIPVLLVLGGSQGAMALNERVLDALPRLVEHYQVIHQTGTANIEECTRLAALVLEGSEQRTRYHPFGFFKTLALKQAAGAADLLLCRAGATTIAEAALWGLPAIVVPLPRAKGDHQRENAFAYARTGAAVVIEEANLTSTILLQETDRLMGNVTERERMRNAARAFARPDAASLIADELLRLGLKHEG
ncbi:MAG: UDP-N-acetylglucosamine--N-acetylmuramyl-(pentapeptide) pyrophosphoryl-undecaprenol N-acetylglucosamine transferase [bacterium]|nr:UDP-N-acetylglucosamine--N-acetylmuramyl-(pentapeptide) pyrophosphoryl-undecaprenol N-acetylglucosamine transferase [bacterium]MDZ4284517.1 UDP-N-acetylglucosamine--N-acetylmuramyl-(pentapeptide) pyrophosphoryl-undecaprenol N-acetylglucosamine transferase [Patescibacteria group bacterium]